MKFVKRLLATLLLLAVFAGTLSGTYVAMAHERIFPDAATLVLYGRDTCAYTTSMRERLAEAGIPFIYANIDAPLIDIEMWYKLDAYSGAVTSARLPVIQINGSIVQRPTFESVMVEYERARQT